MDITKTSPQRKYRQIIQPHEHNFSVPSFGHDFRIANKTNEKNTTQKQSLTDKNFDFKQTMKMAIATVNQPKPLNSVVTNVGPSVDQATDFTYTSRPQLRDTNKELQPTTGLRRQNFNERQERMSDNPKSATPSTKPSTYRPGSVYLPKSRNDFVFTEQNTNSEQIRPSQLPESKQCNNNTRYTVNKEGQTVRSSLQRASSLSRNPYKSVPSFSPLLAHSELRGTFENPTGNLAVKTDLQYSNQMTSQMDYPQWYDHHLYYHQQQQQQQQQQRLQQPTIIQPIQPVQQLHYSGCVFPQNTEASSQVHSSFPSNQTSYFNSSLYNPTNNIGECMFSVSPPEANIANTSNPLCVIPQTYIVTPNTASFSHLKTSADASEASTQPVHQTQLIPGTTVLQPQVAIVAVDPETLRAILSGSFSTQALFQSINMSSNSKTNINMTSSMNLPTQNTDPVPLPVTRTYSQRSEIPTTLGPESDSFHETNKGDKSIDTLCFVEDTKSRSTPPSYTKTENKPTEDQELIEHSSDVQLEQNSSSDKPQKPVPRLGNPPRTLKFLDKSESCEPGGQTEDSHHCGWTSGREPRKLKPSSFIFRSRKASTDEPSNRQKNERNEDVAQPKIDDTGRLCQRQQISSISAYYEKLKRQNSRPLSAYKSTATPQLQPSADLSLLKSSECPSGLESTPVNCRLAHQLTRGYTVASSKPDYTGSSIGSFKERTQIKESDPSIMSVAERAKQWLLAQTSGCRETQRYSTSGFIDQDLVDCQDLVPVEDRVKMFDTGASSSQQTEKSPKVKSELQELREKKQVKFFETNPHKPDSSSKSANPINKSITSVTLQTSRFNNTNPRRPHSSVNLLRVKQEPVQTGMVQPEVKAPHAAHFTNSGLKIAPVKGVQQSNGDELTRLSLNEKRSLFSQRLQQGQHSLTNKPLSASTEPKRAIRRKTQPITLDDLAKANQIILERYYGKHLESPFGSVKGDEQDSFGFHEYDSQISTPEASLLNRHNKPNPSSVICLHRSKYFYTNFSMTTDESEYDYNNSYSNSSADRNHNNIDQYERRRSYTEAMVKSNNEIPGKPKQDEHYTRLKKSSKSFCSYPSNDEYELYTSDKNFQNNSKNEYLKKVYRSSSCNNNNTDDNSGPFTMEMNKEISENKSSKINHHVNLLNRNSEERNQQQIITTNNNGYKNRPVNSLEENGSPEGSQVKIQNKSLSGKLPRTIHYSFNSHISNKQEESNTLNNKYSNKDTIQTENNDQDPQMSIRERIACIRQSSLNWRGRVEKEEPNTDRSCDINKIRSSLVQNQESWKQRVQCKPDNDYAVSERNRRKNSRTSPESFPPNCLDSQYLTPITPKCLPAEPIIRDNSKENRSEPLTRTTSTYKPTTTTKSSPLVKQTTHVSKNVLVPTIEDKALTDFFTSNLVPEPNSPTESVKLPTLSSQTNKDLNTMYERIADARRAARPEKRKPPQDLKNPLKALEERKNVKSNYEEIRTHTELVAADQVSTKNTTPFQPLLRTVDPSDRIGLDFAAKNTILADSAKAGLTSSEDINEAKSNLRSVQEGQSLRTSSVQRQILPYKSIMFLHIKGRRHVQVRLVSPSAKSMNSGDCFILVTANSVFAWFGECANIVEVNKTRELASWIHDKHELSYHGSLSGVGQNSGDGYIAVHENTDYCNATGCLDNDQNNTSDDSNQSDGSALKFWKALGYNSPQIVHPAGPPEEDERFELMIQHTNRVYRVTLDGLIPCEQCWGNPVKYHILQSNQAFVFDFGSEIYLWTGKQITSELRQAGIELVQKAYNINYDFGQCKLNPLDPLGSHSDILASGCKRPEWTLLGKVTEKGETVLFKEKFFDWPDTSRIQIKSLKPGKSASLEVSPAVASLTMEPYSANELYEAAVNNPSPPPNLLTLEGRFIGRGGKVCRYEDGIIRQFWVETNELRVWHISEFSRYELPLINHGQFHREDTYVIRWSYKISFNSLKNSNKRANETVPEHCAYFFWQGSQSKITEKGAAALMTIELDEEKGPQIRVVEGREPPVFCYLFNGRMITHAGKRTTPKEFATRMFIVRGEVAEEGHLIEVPVQLNSLRPQGVLLLLQYTKSLTTDSVEIIKAFCWIGQLVPENYLTTAKYIFKQLKESCPPELGKQLNVIYEIHQQDTNELAEEFLNILKSEDQMSSALYLDAVKSHSRMAIWQFTHHKGRKLGVERLNYTLQPDPESLPLKEKPIKAKITDVSPSTLFTEQITGRLSASQNLITTHLSQSPIEPAFPFLLGDLYSVPQPSLFLIVTQTPTVYIWEGWWPISDLTRSRLMSQKLSRSFSSYSKSPSTPGEQTDDYRWSISLDECFEFSSPTSADGSFELEENGQLALTGTGRARFCAVRKAAMHTAKALADKLGTKAYLIYAGLEPPEFLALFPPYVRLMDAVAYHQFENDKTNRQKDLVDDLLSSYTSASYTLNDLQQRPLPPELDATCLETYLDEQTFQATFSMSKEDFSKLPIWKQTEMKKYFGLF
ncbi:unnamed protein product [Schistosoma turkestanicum]|nr:unnamed protein product [Schistosoma turkestanicum]